MSPQVVSSDFVALQVLANPDILSVLNKFSSMHVLDAVCRTIKNSRSECANYVLKLFKTKSFLKEPKLREGILARMKNPSKQLSLTLVWDDKFDTEITPKMVDVLANTSQLSVHSYGGSAYVAMHRQGRSWPNLKRLVLGDMKNMSDTPLLAKCPNLETLNFSDCVDVTLTHMGGLCKLETLVIGLVDDEGDQESENPFYSWRDSDSLMGYEFSDDEDFDDFHRGEQTKARLVVQPVKTLPSLRTLVLSRCPAAGLRMFGTLPELVKFSLYDPEFTQGSSIVAMSCNITSLAVTGTSLSDFRFLHKLESLEELCIDAGQLADIPANDRIKRMRIDTQVFGGNIPDYTDLRKFKNLEVLQIFDRQFADIAALKDLVALKKLDIQETLVKDIKPITNLPLLEFLDISLTRVERITPLRNLRSLKTLILGKKLHIYKDLNDFVHPNNPEVIKECSLNHLIPYSL